MARVSICIPVLNGEPHLATAIRSVLDQGYSDLEIIIGDNASTDSSREIAGSFLSDPRVTLMSFDQQLGMADNWNRVLSYATGEFVKVMAHDDVLLEGCIERQVEALDQHPEAVITACRRRIIDDSGRVILSSRGLRGMNEVTSAADVRREAVRAGTNPIGEGVAVLCRTKALREEAGGFAGDRGYVTDLDAWLRTSADTPLIVDHAVLAEFRVSASGFSTRRIREQAADVRSLLCGLRAAYPADIGRGDLLIGKLKSRALQMMRGALYFAMGMRQQSAAPRSTQLV